MSEDPNELGGAGGALKWKLLNVKHLDPWVAGAGNCAAPALLGLWAWELSTC